MPVINIEGDRKPNMAQISCKLRWACLVDTYVSNRAVWPPGRLWCDNQFVSLFEKLKARMPTSAVHRLSLIAMKAQTIEAIKLYRYVLHVAFSALWSA